MATLHMIQVRPDMKSMFRFLKDQGLQAKGGSDDLGYGVHAWLKAAFADLAPQPWRLLMDRRRPVRVLGYAGCNAARLRRHMKEFADPGAFEVCADPDSDIAGREMPNFTPGRRLGFELQCCPVGRKARTGIEKDVFLIRADQVGGESLQRDAVYCDWARERLQRDNAVDVISIRLEGFQLAHQMRKSQEPGARKQGRLIRPQALLHGELIVNKTDALSHLLARGIGRHRSFGYGMLLLRPPS